MHRLTRKFARWCKQHFDLTAAEARPYQSLSLCVLDCVYSLRCRYYAVTLPIVDRYAARFMEGDRYAPGDTLSAFLGHVEDCGGAAAFAEEVVKNHQKLGGSACVPKEEVCVQLAEYLQQLGIDTLEDFRAYPHAEALEKSILSVKGMGRAGTNYLFMLAGDQSRIKADVHIHRSVVDACGERLSDADCEQLFREAAKLLQKEFPGLTPRALDWAIWKVYQSGRP